MIRFSRAQIHPIGVDIGADSVTLLQLESADQTISAFAGARQSLSKPAPAEPFTERTAAAADVIRHMLRQHPFSGRKIVAALPRQIVQVKNLRLPSMPMDEVRSAIEFEVKSIFPFDPKDAHIQFLHAGEVRQGTETKQEVIVIAASREDVDAFVCQVHRSGAVIASLDFEAAAIYRSVERFIRRREDEQEVNVLVDVGGARTQVVIGRGQNISFFKAIEIGGQHLHEAVARRLGISVDEAYALRRRLSNSENALSMLPDASPSDPVRQAVFDAGRSVMESLAAEVSLCLRYHSVTFRGHRPTKVRVVGDEACDPQLIAVFNSGLQIPAAPARPLHSVDTSRLRAADRRGHMSEWNTAFGLGLKLTTGRFGARDGKPRDPMAPRPDLGVVDAQVDLADALPPTPENAAAHDFAEPPAEIRSPAPTREVVHA
jgi:type IV pilus assembly protein PilM